MVCGVVRGLGDGGVSESGPSVCRRSYVCGGSVNRDVKIV